MDFPIDGFKSAVNSLRDAHSNIPDTEVIKLTDGVYLRVCSYAPTGEEVKRERGEVQHIQTQEGYTDETIASDIYDYNLEYLPIDFRLGITPDCDQFDIEKQKGEYTFITQVESNFKDAFFQLFEEEFYVAQKYPENTTFEFQTEPVWILHKTVPELVWFYGPTVCLPLKKKP